MSRPAPHFDRGKRCLKRLVFTFLFICFNNTTNYLNKIKQIELMGITGLEWQLKTKTHAFQVDTQLSDFEHLEVAISRNTKR